MKKHLLLPALFLISFMNSFAQVEFHEKYAIIHCVDERGKPAPDAESSSNFITFMEDGTFVTEIDFKANGLLYVYGDYNIGNDAMLTINMNGPQLLEKTNAEVSKNEGGEEFILLNMRFMDSESKVVLPNILTIINSETDISEE